MDPVLSHHTSQERQPAAMPELPNNEPHQSTKQSHAEDHTEQIEATRSSPKNRQDSEQEDCCWGLKGWTRGEGEEAGKPKKMSEWDGVLVEILSGMDI